MKKLISKLSLRRHKAPLQEPEGRITNDTLAEHREKVLAGGRKFKYPVQYARHKLVANAIIISAAAVILLVGLGGYFLYQAQNTSDFMYRVTKVIPVPVAVVDGQPVRYSDYLMKYRSAEHYLLKKGNIDERSESGQSQLKMVKEQAMADSVADAYAAKLAKNLNIEVSNADFEVFLKQQRQSNDGEVSEATYAQVIDEFYNWSMDEYRDAMKSKLLRQKVEYALDTKASTTAKAIEASITAGNTDLAKIAQDLNAQNQTVTYVPDTWVPRSNQDGGLAAAAAKLQKGQVSTAIKNTSGEGYYYVKLIDSNSSQLQYAYIQVPLKAFDAKLKDVEKQGKLQYLITIEHPAGTDQP